MMKLNSAYDNSWNLLLASCRLTLHLLYQLLLACPAQYGFVAPFDGLLPTIYRWVLQ